MAIEMQCTGCGQTLRVGDEHAGRESPLPQVRHDRPGAGRRDRNRARADAGRARSPWPPDTTSEPLSYPAPFGTETKPAADQPEEPFNPYASPTAPASRSYLKPHRGPLVLTLGLVGLVCGCHVLGIPAWILGAQDLREIREGRMDPAGEGLTQAGMIIGIIASVLVIINAVLVMLAMLA